MLIVVSFASLSESTELADAFWLADTPVNRVLAAQAWSSATTDPNGALFNKDLGDDATSAVLNIFDDVELHHPNWREIRFFGTALTTEISMGFTEMQLQTKPTEEGFIVER